MKFQKVISQPESGFKNISVTNSDFTIINSTRINVEGPTFGENAIPDSSILVLETDVDGAINIDGASYEIPKADVPEFTEKDITYTNTYTLLRTNPKYTGNVKIVIDSNEDMYLDTFKVNTTLSKSKYHKVPISYKSYYGKDVMSTFSEVTSDDFYCVSEDDRKLYTPAPNLSKQFIDTYRCGAKTNTDTTYSEGFSILSPLNIGTIIPDFFVVFKVENATPQSLKKENILEFLIKNGIQIKTFDLRDGSKIGTYLRNIQKNSSNISAPIFMSRMEDGQVVYNGISLDKGVVSSAYETNRRNISDNSISYNSYEEMNYILTEGFERNRLISANTVNIEFMFDDPSSNQFEINTYFGVYISLNNLNKDIYYDGKTIKTDDGEEAIYKEMSDDSRSALSKIIYGFVDRDGFARCKTKSDEDSYKNKMKNSLGECLVNIEGSIVETDGRYNSFITFSLNDINAAMPGEHYRIIDYLINGSIDDENTCPCIYEVVLSDNTFYDDVIGVESLYYKTITISKDDLPLKVEIAIHTIPIYVNNIKGAADDESKLKLLTKYIYNAFNLFTPDQNNEIHFKATRYSGNSLTIGGIQKKDINQLIFERISHLTSYSSESSKGAISTLKDYIDDDKTSVSVFGNYIPDAMVLDFLSKESPIYEDKKYALLTPFYFEDLKARIVYATDFYQYKTDVENKTKFYDAYITPSNYILDSDLCYNKRTSLNETEYSEYDKINISTYHLNENGKIENTVIKTNAIQSFRNSKKYMFRFEGERLYNDTISLHKHNLFDRVICNIIPVMDYDLSLSGESNDWKQPTKFFENDNINTIYHLMDIGINRSNSITDASLDLDGLLTELRESKRSLVNSFVSPYIFKWNGLGSNNETTGERINIPFSNFENYKVHEDDASISESKNLHNIDLSRVHNKETLRTNILNGVIDFKDIIDEIAIENGNKKNYTDGAVLYKTDEHTFGVIERGFAKKISYTNIINDTLLNNINGCTLFNIQSKTTGDNYQTELYIDEPNKRAYFINYSGISSDGNGFILHSNNVLSSSIKMDIDGKININANISDTSTNVEFALYSDSATITGEGTYDPSVKIITCKNYKVFFHKTSSDDSSVNYDMLSYLYLEDNKQKIITRLSHLLMKSINFNLSYKLNSDQDTIKEIITLWDNNLNYLPVFLKMGDETGYTLYEDNYDVSVISEVVDTSINIYTDSSLMEKTLNIFITPKISDVFEISSDELKYENDPSIKINCEVLSGYKWKGDLIYNKYWETDLNISNDSSIGEQDRIMIDGEFHKTNTNNNEYPNILRHAFDNKMYHAKSQYKFIKDNVSAKIKRAKPIKINDESYKPGYSSGYIIKTFLNSLSMQKRSKDSDGNLTNNLEITNWSKIFKSGGYIYYDLSDTIENQIASNKNFTKIWKFLNADSRENKIKFIKNTIIPMLHINDSMQIEVLFEISKSDSFPVSYIKRKGTKLDNPSISIVTKNDKYLLKLKPQSSVKGIYHVKCNITL